jgi:hypothetical protein
MDNKKIRNIATWVMIIFIIVLGLYLVYYVNTESHKCLNNPYTYSVKLLEKANDGNVSCMCLLITKDMSLPFGWDRKGFKLPDDIPLGTLNNRIK